MTKRETCPLHLRPDCHAEEAQSAVPGTGRRQADEASTAAWDHARACVTAVMRATTRVAPTTTATAPRGQDALGPRKGRGRSMTMASPHRISRRQSARLLPACPADAGRRLPLKGGAMRCEGAFSMGSPTAQSTRGLFGYRVPLFTPERDTQSAGRSRKNRQGGAAPLDPHKT